MAVFTFTSPAPATGIEFQNFLQTTLNGLTRMTMSSTQFSIIDSVNDDRITFSGTGLTYVLGDPYPAFVPVPVTGVINGLTILDTDSHTTLMKATGLNANGIDMFSALFVGTADFISYLLRGNDQITMTAFADTIDGGAGNDVIHGKGGNDGLFGGKGSDRLFGEGGMNNLIGDAGNDTIYGGSKADSIMGGGGNDLIYGGAGENSIYGNGGKDQFIFTAAPNAENVTHIYGFQQGVDKIVLDNDVFTKLSGSGALSGAQFHVGAAAADASDRIIYDPLTNLVSYDRDGTGSLAAIVIGQVFGTGAANMHANDFVILT